MTVNLLLVLTVVCDGVGIMRWTEDRLYDAYREGYWIGANAFICVREYVAGVAYCGML